LKIIENRAMAPPGSTVVVLYRSGDTVRGYVLTRGTPDTEDTIFPSEEMEPEAAFRVAQTHNQERDTPIYIELEEDLTWNPAWNQFFDRDRDASE
jgi:hypothetical protein